MNKQETMSSFRLFSFSLFFFFLCNRKSSFIQRRIKSEEIVFFKRFAKFYLILQEFIIRDLDFAKHISTFLGISISLL